MKLEDCIEPQYFNLKALAAYSSCSVRWLRYRLCDQNHPLPYYRIEGKILIKREDFDLWMSLFRRFSAANDVSTIVESVLTQIRPSK